MPFDHPEAYFEDGVEVPDGIPVFPFGGVLTEIHVQFPVEVIFYPPMAPDLCIEGFSGVRCAADVIAGLVLGLAGFLEIALRADTDDGFKVGPGLDRKSTRLNSSHVKNAYAVFCLKKKKS